MWVAEHAQEWDLALPFLVFAHNVLALEGTDHTSELLFSRAPLLPELAGAAAVVAQTLTRPGWTAASAWAWTSLPTWSR